MPRTKPTAAQAQLQLQLYDLRREEKLRQARDWFLQNYFVDQPEDHNRLAPPGSLHDTYVRMVLSYWDQASALLTYGLLHEELYFDTTNEFYLAWDRIRAHVPAMRQLYRNPHHFEHLERAAKRYEKYMERRAPGYLEVLAQFMQKWREASAARRPP